MLHPSLHWKSLVHTFCLLRSFVEAGCSQCWWISMSTVSFEPEAYSGHTSDCAKRTLYKGRLVTGSLNATWSGSGDNPCKSTAALQSNAFVYVSVLRLCTGRNCMCERRHRLLRQQLYIIRLETWSWVHCSFTLNMMGVWTGSTHHIFTLNCAYDAKDVARRAQMRPAPSARKVLWFHTYQITRLEPVDATLCFPSYNLPQNSWRPVWAARLPAPLEGL